MMPFGSSPRSTASMSARNWFRSITMPWSERPRCSFSRSETTPWPIQAMVSWLITCVEIQRPVTGSVICAFQYGIFSCTYGSCSRGTAVQAQTTDRVWVSSTGTRYSKWVPPGMKMFGIRCRRGWVQTVLVSSVFSRIRL